MANLTATLAGDYGVLLDATKVVANFDTVPESATVIGTHDGTFHGDEVIACAMLKILPQYQDAIIVRTRDNPTLDKCQLVVDVGGKYDVDSNRFDHHMREFSDQFSELGFATKLSSAGLIYRHYGKDILQKITGSDNDAMIAALYRKTYKSFMEEIDGIDNGIEAFGGSDCNRNYEVTSTLSGRIGRMNPEWNDDTSTDARNACFRQAVGVAGREFLEVVNRFARAWWPARSVVAEALDGAAALHPSRQIIELSINCPWDAHLFELEEERVDTGAKGLALYVLYADSAGKYRVQAVPEQEGSFTSRKKLPEPWRGLKAQELSDACGVPGGVFVHAGGFIGGNNTREGAIAMAITAAEF